MDGLPGVAIVEHGEGVGASMAPWLGFGYKVQDDGVALVFQCVVFLGAIVVDNVSVLSVCTASEAWCIDAGCHVPLRHQMKCFFVKQSVKRVLVVVFDVMIMRSDVIHQLTSDAMLPKVAQVHQCDPGIEVAELDRVAQPHRLATKTGLWYGREDIVVQGGLP